MRRLAAADGCYGAALVTMPLIGVDLIRLAAGRDLGLGLQPAYLLLAVAWLLRLVSSLTAAGARDRRRHRAAGIRPWSGWALAAVGAVALSSLGLALAPAPLLRHEAWPRFAKQVAQLAVMGAFLAYPALWTRGGQRWRWTMRLVAWTTGLQLVYALAQGLATRGDLAALAAVERIVTSNRAILSGSDRLYLGGFTDLPRLRGTMCEPLYLGSYLIGVLPWLLWSGRRWLAGATVAALLATWSRGAWVAGLASLGLLMVWRWRAGLPRPSRGTLGAAAAVLAAVAAGLLVVSGPDSLTWPVRRLLQTFDRSDWSNLTRFYSGQAAWRAFLASPLVGVGWGQFPYHFYALVDLPGLESQFAWPVVNSAPLLVLCETGLIGAGVWLGALGTAFARTWRRLAADAPAAARARLAAAAAASCAVGLHLCIFSQYNLPHLWILPGLWLAALAEVRIGSGTERRRT
ncbi:MAG TPA: O-antigen ligase family protein [Candidatus Krumholzibacteria bacterium]|nr:O-antigen ligase family protein [Candidatus Krumholzibacteria bacterium]HPD71749.1 O-antigen ligase family protein [Candidatus Krumholzibacteria bacterium]HRY41318.1 O-antigen ligase family protein [Candidatus Krumholzibacteria bacterium]